MFIHVIALAIVVAAQQAAPAKGLQNVDLKTLAANYEKLNGREIIVSGVVYSGEGRVMLLPGISRDGTDEQMWVTFTPSLASHPGVLERQYIDWPIPYVVATLRGRFVAVRDHSFGHQLCCRFKLEVTKVIEVKEYKPR